MIDPCRNTLGHKKTAPKGGVKNLTFSYLGRADEECRGFFQECLGFFPHHHRRGYASLLRAGRFRGR